MEVLARTFFDSDTSGNSKRGGIQARVSRNGFDLDKYRGLPCSDSTKAAEGLSAQPTDPAAALLRDAFAKVSMEEASSRYPQGLARPRTE